MKVFKSIRQIAVCAAFDEGRLNPSFGYFFDRRWLAPQEAIVSIAWKFARMNALPGDIVTRQFAQHQVDPYEGIAATAVEIAVAVLARAFAISRLVLREGIEPVDGSRPMHTRLRFRTKCMKLGYHGVMHQRHLLSLSSRVRRAKATSDD